MSSLELPSQHHQLLSKQARKRYCRMDQGDRHVFVQGFRDGLRSDELSMKASYGAAYARGWLAGEAIRKRTYLAGVRDGLDDAEHRRSPKGLEPNGLDGYFAQLDRLLNALYAKGLADGRNSQGVSSP